MEIEVKSLFNGWCEVPKKQAIDYIQHRLCDLSYLKKEKTFDYINETILRGITAQELFKDIDLMPVIKHNIYDK